MERGESWRKRPALAGLLIDYIIEETAAAQEHSPGCRFEEEKP